MKKLLSVLLTVLLLTACGSSDKPADGSQNSDTACSVLNVFNWGEYIGENTIADFEDKFGVRVNYALFDSNEMMYTKLMGGGSYDILIPSDYMIERLIAEDLLQPIDKSIITNFGNLYPGVLNKEYDMDNTYSVPYFWAMSVSSMTRLLLIGQMSRARAGMSCTTPSMPDRSICMIPKETPSWLL